LTAFLNFVIQFFASKMLLYQQNVMSFRFIGHTVAAQNICERLHV